MSRGRDQEDHSLKTAQANSLQDPISKITNTKKGLVERPHGGKNHSHLRSTDLS
jgi:hypothetical protein